MPKFLIVGLGNIGPQYSRTRHNVGFMCIDHLADFFSLQSFKSKNFGLYSEYKSENFSALFVKPTTLMNLSGKALMEFKKYYNPDEIIVIHDDIDMKFGKIRLKYNNSDGGHNGLKSIRQYIGNEYWKFKIGIDRPLLHDDVVNYVLGKFSKDEIYQLGELFFKIAHNFDTLLFEKDLFASKVTNK